MKDSNIKSKVLVVLVILFTLSLLLLSPKIVNKLVGSVSSNNTVTNEIINTGVVLNTNKLYSENSTIELNIYNGTNSIIEITGIVKNEGVRKYCDECEYKITDITPITITQNEDKKYLVDSNVYDDSNIGEIGVRYSISKEENGIVTTDTYFITSVVGNSAKLQAYEYNNDVYQKDNLNTAMQNAIVKLNKKDEEVDNDSWINYAMIYEEAYNSIMSNSDISQEEIDDITNKLNNTDIQTLPSANYNSYNNLISTISSSKEEWFDSDAYDAFEEVYNLRNNYINLSNAYQVKLDKYVSRLQSAYDTLYETIKEADYSKVNSAVETAGLIKNETADKMYDLYTQETWKALKVAIRSVVYDLKIDEQKRVDSFATNIANAIAGLKVDSAIYDDLEALIANYEDTKAYIYDWYTAETKNAVDEYIENINFELDITHQDEVDEMYDELSTLIDALELKPAKGLHKSDNYYPFEGALSIDEYIEIIKGFDKSLYTEKSQQFIEMLTDEDSDEIKYVYSTKIDNQEEIDYILKVLHRVINDDYLEKKLGNYTDLCRVYKKALNLNLDIYQDVSEVKNVMWNLDWNLKIDEQERIDTETNRLSTAIDNLVKKPANYNAYNEIYNIVKNLNKNYYENFSDMQNAINHAKEVTNLTIDRQSDVDEATNMMQNAYSNLVLKNADYSKINALKTTIESLNPSKYTNFEIVEKAMQSIVYGKKIDKQNEVDQMYNKLKNAYDNLDKIKADYTSVKKAIDNAKKYESSKGIYLNYSALEKAINDVNYELKYDEQNKVDEYAKNINDAVKGLIKKPANYSELSAVLSKIPRDYSNYDKSLQDEIDAYLDEAKKLDKNLKIDDQEKVNALVNKGKNLLIKITDINNELSSEIVLSYLKVNGKKINISKLPFKVSVDYDVIEANVEVGLVSNTATSTVYGGKVLVPGDNNITIVVTDNGNVYTYILTINKKMYSDYLKELEVNGKNINFAKTKQEYNVKVSKDSNKLNLKYLTEDKDAKVTVSGNKDLKNGSKVKIKVESPDGNVRIYTLNVAKPGSVSIITILILIISLTLIAGILKYIREKKYNNA